MSSLRSENTSKLQLYFLHLRQPRALDNSEPCGQEGENHLHRSSSRACRMWLIAKAAGGTVRGRHLCAAARPEAVHQNSSTSPSRSVSSAAVHHGSLLLRKVIYSTLRGNSTRTGCLVMVVPPPMRGMDSRVLTGAHATSKRCSLEDALKGQLSAATPSADSSASTPESSVLGGVEFTFGNLR